MKDKTKRGLVVAGAGAAVLYFLTRPKDEEGGFGGGGGAPLLPMIPEAVTEDAPSAAPMVFNFPAMEAPIDWGEDPVSKKDVEVPGIMITYDEPIGPPVSAKSPIKIVDPAYVGGVLTKKGEAKTTPGKPWYKPWTWDADEAVESYQAWATASTKRTLGISPSSKSTTKTKDSIRDGIVRGEKSKIASALAGRYASRSGSERTRSDAFTSMGQRTYSAARSAALSSSKKAQSRPGSPD